MSWQLSEREIRSVYDRLVAEEHTRDAEFYDLRTRIQGENKIWAHAVLIIDVLCFGIDVEVRLTNGLWWLYGLAAVVHILCMLLTKRWPPSAAARQQRSSEGRSA